MTHDALVDYLDGHKPWSLPRWCTTHESEALRMRYAELLMCGAAAWQRTPLLYNGYLDLLSCYFQVPVEQPPRVCAFGV